MSKYIKRKDLASISYHNTKNVDWMIASSILAIVANRFACSEIELLSRESKAKRLTDKTRIAVYYINKYTRLTEEELGVFFGIHRSIVHYYCHGATKYINRNKEKCIEIKKQIEEIISLTRGSIYAIKKLNRRKS